MNTDIAIIGGGASGLMAAISAKMTNPSKKVLVIEKLQRVGKKIIASGNGKCNLSNTSINNYNYHGSINALEIIRRTPDYKTLFSDILGIMCVTGSEGRSGGVYPHSNSSTTVLNAIRLKMQELGVNELCDCEITEIIPIKTGFELIHRNGSVKCRKLIIAAGGYAAPSFGTNGSIMRILENIGYTSAEVCPAVAPLKVNPDDVKSLKGIRIKCSVAAASGTKTLRTERGELQFNENNISGICVFNLAYFFQKYSKKLSLKIDLLPDIRIDILVEYLHNLKKIRSNLPIEEFLTGIFVKNLAVYLTKRRIHRPLSEKISTLTSEEIADIAFSLKSLEFKVTGCSPWQNAQATMGGITSSQVDENLQSRIHKNLFFCGEILDTVGDCGGYNLQWAWSSGFLVGRKAASDGKNK